MAAGTILVTSDSDQVLGAGTSFLADVKPDDIISTNANGITYALAVKSVESNTALTLVKKYIGITTSNLAYYVIPPELLMDVPAQLSQDIQYLMRAFIYEKDAWTKILTESQNQVTIHAPDGTEITGPTLKYLGELAQQATSVNPNPPPTTGFGLYRAKSISVTTSITLDLSIASYFKLTLNAPNCTIAFSNPSQMSDVVQEIAIKLKQGNGTNKVTWPSNIKWPNGMEPKLSYTANKEDLVTLISDDKGATWTGVFAGASY